MHCIQVVSMSTLTLSARLEKKTIEKLDKLAKATKRSKSFLAAEAIEKFVQDQLWQIEAIEKGIEEADKGNFAEESEVKEFFKKWNVNAD